MPMMAGTRKRRRICLLGATGLVGSALIEAAIGRDDLRIVAVARREAALPQGARMEVIVAPVEQWDSAIAAVGADVLVCALGTTMKAVGGDREAFRAVDHDLVIESARAAAEAGIRRMVLVSSVGADSGSNSFYLRTKGGTEDRLRKLGFERLDILRPALLVGRRRPVRPAERLAMLFAPLADLMLHGSARRFRSIGTDRLARAIIALCHERSAGKFVHEHDALIRAAKRSSDFAPALPEAEIDSTRAGLHRRRVR